MSRNHRCSCFIQVAVGWKVGDVDNHEEHFNYREGVKAVLHCDHCTNTYKTELGLTKHISRMHSQDDNANISDPWTSSQPPAKKRRISVNPKSVPISNAFDQDVAVNVNLLEDIIDLKAPIKIDGSSYRLCLLFDKAEETTKEMNERQKLKKLLNGYSSEKRLVVGDFCWSLVNEDIPDICYVYPLIIERKRKDDLLASMEDGRYREQKTRMKQCLPDFHHIYLLERFAVNKKDVHRIHQAQVDTEARDGFHVHWTSGRIDTAIWLNEFSLSVYEQIIIKARHSSSESDFFQNAHFIDFWKFQKCWKTAITQAEMFAGMLLSIGVHESAVSLITARYPTMRCLVEAWNQVNGEEEKRRMLCNLNCNSWMQCRVNGHYTNDVDIRILLELERIGDKPINEALSAALYERFAV